MSSLAITPKSITLSLATDDLKEPIKDIFMPPDIFAYIFGFLPLKKVAEIALTSRHISVIVRDYFSTKLELDVERIPWAKYLLEEIARQNARPQEKIREFFTTLRIYKNQTKTQIALNQKFALAPTSKEIALNIGGVWRNHKHFCDVIAQAIKVSPPSGKLLEDSIIFFNRHDTEMTALSELNIGINEPSYYLPPLIGRCKNLTKLSFSHLPHELNRNNPFPHWNNTFSLCPQISHLEKLEEFSCDLVTTNIECLYSLTHLTVLNLWAKDTYLPLTADVSKLKSLKKLNIPATTLPREIGWLTELEKLTVRLPDSCTSLPEELGKLTKLTMLDISCRKLQRLPDTLKDLHNLDFLRLNSLHIKSPPAWVYTHEKWSEACAIQNSNTGFFCGYGKYIKGWMPYSK